MDFVRLWEQISLFSNDGFLEGSSGDHVDGSLGGFQTNKVAKVSKKSLFIDGIGKLNTLLFLQETFLEAWRLKETQVPGMYLDSIHEV